MQAEVLEGVMGALGDAAAEVPLHAYRPRPLVHPPPHRLASAGAGAENVKTVDGG